MKGVQFPMDGIRKGYLFDQKWYIKGKGLHREAEPPRIRNVDECSPPQPGSFCAGSKLKEPVENKKEAANCNKQLIFWDWASCSFQKSRHIPQFHKFNFCDIITLLLYRRSLTSLKINLIAVKASSFFPPYLLFPRPLLLR